MRRLFILECKKIVTGVIYWLFVVALAVVFWLNYGNVDGEQIRDASSPSSMFYCAQDGQYAEEQDHLSGKDGQNQMMQGLTKKLLHSYENNSYEYYPFDYIKTKVFSDSEQKIVLEYLQEITGMDQKELLMGTEETTPEQAEEAETPEETGDSEKSGKSEDVSDSSEIGVSGEGQYIARPGTGKMNEAGQYEFQPDEWEYVENLSGTAREKEENSSRATGNSKESQEFSASMEQKGSGEISIRVSFQRFMEIMDEISDMIGKNSYFSRSLIDLYYGDSDMEDSPVTLKQHEEFYNGDQITGAFARYYCDSIVLAVLVLPAFVIAAMMAGDRRNKVKELVYTKPISGFKLIFIRYLAAVGMMFVPVLLLPFRSFIILTQYADSTGVAIDLFAFPKYIFCWILPTLLFVAALSLLLDVLVGSSVSILAMGIFWFFFKPSVSKLAGGNYELCDIAIRHNTLKGFGKMMQHFDLLVMNRIFITSISFLLVLFSVWIYEVKRKGGLRFHVRKFIRYRKREL